MTDRFTYGERKIWLNIKKSQNVMKMIAEDFKDISLKGNHKCYMDQA